MGWGGWVWGGVGCMGVDAWWVVVIVCVGGGKLPEGREGRGGRGG